MENHKCVRSQGIHVLQEHLRRNITLLLVARAVVRLVCAANGGGAVVVADHLDLDCGCACWQSVQQRKHVRAVALQTYQRKAWKE